MEFPLPHGNTSLAYHSTESHDGMKSEAHEDAAIRGIYDRRPWEHLSRSQRALGRRLLAEGIQPSTIVAEFGWSTSTVYKLKNDQYNDKDLKTDDAECIDAHAGAILRKLVDSNDARAHSPWQHLVHADHARCRFLLQHGVKPRALSAETGWSASTIDKIKHDKHVKKIYDKTQDFKYIDAATWAMLRKLEVQGPVKTKGKMSRVRKSKHTQT
ncbi:hypothetical protein C8R43DRAFT_966496 [Mycena crocata]|nr:hypothetical protein C8R43DRAFT_966496 [Mycena crocata]